VINIGQEKKERCQENLYSALEGLFEESCE
jgi:hypothetical protein